MQGPVAYVHPVVTEIYSIHHQAVQSFAERVNCADHDSLPKSREPSTRTMLQIRQEECDFQHKTVVSVGLSALTPASVSPQMC
jgi:hypothetical protein